MDRAPDRKSPVGGSATETFIVSRLLSDLLSAIHLPARLRLASADDKLSGQPQTLQIKQLVGLERLAAGDMPQAFEQFAHQRHDAFRA